MPKSDEWSVVINDKDLDKQIARGKAIYDEYVEGKPVAKSFTFEPADRIVTIRATDGSRIDFPVSKIRELQNASDSEIGKGYISKAGDAIHWDNLDAHYTVAGLAAKVFGTKEWMRHLGSIGGRKTSPVKAAAARSNGSKGGRPPKLPPSSEPVRNKKGAR